MRYDFKKQLRSFKFAFKGIATCFGKEQNFDFHIIATVVTIVAGCCLNITRYEWIAVTICIGMVITAEMFNSAIERIVNFVSPDYNLDAGKIKDIAAGAVLVTAIAAAVTGLLIFVPHILELFNI